MQSSPARFSHSTRFRCDSIAITLAVAYLLTLSCTLAEIQDPDVTTDLGNADDPERRSTHVCGKCGKMNDADEQSVEELYPKPVCGTDGEVYSSLCGLRRASCEQNRTIERQEWDNCADKQSLCPDKCLDLYDPVCGQDNVVYLNYCVMQRKNCGKPMKTIDLVSCLAKARQARKLSGCPDECLPIYEPVCDLQGDVHYNECFLRKAVCENSADGLSEPDVKVLPLNTCVDLASSRCPEKCLEIMDPVCGSDGKRYLNHCKFAQENCRKGTKKMPWVYCLGEMDIDQPPQ
ncbi:agrin-like [Tropilaelaps mercedesae]|uniref:Agrin-like n=1 Tax=Tropilaelaps mercedesae TaxID=418985 RepID=A0A1V9X2J0_9ACAR|nr:agrin-like [Tropilaelaps mercedesae]